MKYSKQELIGKLVKFKNENNRYPKYEDFRKMDVSPRPYYSRFGGLKTACEIADKCQSGEFKFDDDISKPAEAFQCFYCGAFITGANNYYSSLTNILITRFTKLLNATQDRNYFIGILDCIYQVWGGNNVAVRQELKKAGYIEEFDTLHNIQKQEEDKYMVQCPDCKRMKDGLDMTVRKDGKWQVLVCEDCLPRKQ